MLRAVNCFGETHPSGGPGLFVSGTLEQNAAALAEEYRSKAQLVYLDPPFCTGARFMMGKALEKTAAYDDMLDAEAFMALMRLALTTCKEMLVPSGSIYVHIDYRMGARVKLLLDEIFGENSFMNEIVWSYKSGGRSKRYYSRKHDTILFYRRSSKVFFDITAVGTPRGAQPRNHMKRRIDEDGRIYFSIRSGSKTYRYYEDAPVYPGDVWDDIEHMHQRDPERTGYATQKPEALLKRVILASSRAGDLVADLFSGSGTTAAVCQKLNRRYLALDASPLSLLTFRKRLLLAASAASFLEKSHEMRLRYHEFPRLTTEPKVVFTEGKGAKRIVYEGGAELSYLAAGRLEEGIFHPEEYLFSPKAGDFLALDKGAFSFLQACDTQGQMGFFSMECGQ
ncbi:MAG TPA: site-specific DNA-methyltransferase [Clostridia bacterium]|nr:site-specific DNA-methyltransferase [Clostridia bacterium]